MMQVFELCVVITFVFALVQLHGWLVEQRMKHRMQQAYSNLTYWTVTTCAISSAFGMMQAYVDDRETKIRRMQHELHTAQHRRTTSQDTAHTETRVHR